jgi:hypothetical protein
MPVRLRLLQVAGADYEQIPRSSRRNPLPVERINRSLLMRQEHLACALLTPRPSVQNSGGGRAKVVLSVRVTAPPR